MKGERVCQGIILPLPRVRFVHGDLGADANHKRTGRASFEEKEGGGDERRRRVRAAIPDGLRTGIPDGPGTGHKSTRDHSPGLA